MIGRSQLVEKKNSLKILAFKSPSLLKFPVTFLGLDKLWIFFTYLISYLLIQTMTSDKNLSAFVRAMKTGQTGCYQLITLYVATTFEECTACRPCEVLHSSVEYLQMRALREYLKDKIIYM